MEEHYIDAHGYTEINFAAFAMIGMRFCPRIRNMQRQRICCPNRGRDHRPLETVLQRGRRAINFRLIAEQWERIGQFYAANREIGRVFKTVFMLRYMAEPPLRAKVRRGTLKVEQLHALARAVYYGDRSRISARDVYDQINACSCLTLILACIICWQRRGPRALSWSSWLCR